jgi:hypothetical protein
MEEGVGSVFCAFLFNGELPAPFGSSGAVWHFALSKTWK